MNDPIVWIIIAAFYAPLHFLLPILSVALGAPDATSRRRGIHEAALWAAVSMAIAFALVIWLAGEHLSLAMGILFVSLLAPLGKVLWMRRGWKERGPESAPP